MMSDFEIQTLMLTFKVAMASAILVVPLATLAALFLLKLPSPTQIFGLSLLSLPMALPPVVTGYLLLMLLGRQSSIGIYLFENFEVQISFSFAGAVLASSIVSFPFALRSVMVSLKSIDKSYIDAALTLKITKWKTFWWIIVPLSWPGILGAGILAFVRAFGEFGATVVFAGSVFGESRTLSIAMWNLMQAPENEGTMWRLLIISVLFCLAALITSEILFKRMNNLCSNR